jgi:lipoic acid synthetase
MSTVKRSPLPEWLKISLPSGETYQKVKQQMDDGVLHTVCAEARCPNIAECWGGGTATFMILGDTCTRGCRFCSVSTALKPAPPDPAEPARLGESLAKLDLTYTVITTVCRDDLADQGAGHVAACVRAIRAKAPKLLVEFLIQDFRGDKDCLRTIIQARPDVLAHNLETVERLTHPVRDAKAGYQQSLDVLKFIKDTNPELYTKSSLMVGLGETEEEIREAMQDLRAARCDILTIGQYLRPTTESRHLPVSKFVHPDVFKRYETMARELGFLYVASGPMVRSSYRAGELFMEGLLREKKK